MKKIKSIDKSRLFFWVILISSLLLSSCVPVVNKPVKITEIAAKNKTVYVQMETELTCFATSLTGDKLTYKWSADNGKLSGEGQKVTWTSPNAYGDVHIMVIAQDTKGNSDQATTTIKVIYNPDPVPCPSCNK